MNTRRLYRSRTDRQLAGVAAGVAEYLDLDPTLVRVLWILSIFLGGFTILLYVILAFVMPLEPETGAQRPAWAAGRAWDQGGAWSQGGGWVPGGMPAAAAAGAGPTGTGPAGTASDNGEPRGNADDLATDADGASTTAADGAATTDADPDATATAMDVEATAGTTSAGGPNTGAWEAVQAAWAAPAWSGRQGSPTPTTEPARNPRRGPRATVYAGVLLVVFGVIALADAVVPGLSGLTLVPALLVALGTALLIGSVRRPAGDA